MISLNYDRGKMCDHISYKFQILSNTIIFLNKKIQTCFNDKFVKFILKKNHVLIILGSHLKIKKDFLGPEKYRKF